VASEVVLRDGTRAVIWPVLPTDREGLAEGYRRLDAEARYHRFLSSVPQLSEPMLDRLIDGVDGIDHVALVMIAFDDDWQSMPAGVARMIRYAADPTAADVAVTVAKELRGRGAATALIEELVAQRPEGVERIVTEVAFDNPASLRMLERAGATTFVPAGPGAFEVTVELGDPNGSVPSDGGQDQ
jgi:RimJ/RimL family protein N-acetyltransferase